MCMHGCSRTYTHAAVAFLRRRHMHVCLYVSLCVCLSPSLSLPLSLSLSVALSLSLSLFALLGARGGSSPPVQRGCAAPSIHLNEWARSLQERVPPGLRRVPLSGCPAYASLPPVPCISRNRSLTHSLSLSLSVCLCTHVCVYVRMHVKSTQEGLCMDIMRM